MSINKLSAALITLLFLGQVLVSSTVAQSKSKAKGADKADKVIEDPDITPIYVGGTGEMHRFIANNLRYPREAVEKNTQGLVVYTFVVEKDGTLSNFELIHRADSLLDAEALRILQSMPAWRPARHKGVEVRSKSYVPMYFRLNPNARRAVATKTAPPVAKTDTVLAKNTDIYTIVDKMPQFESGERGLANFISRTLRYPIDARQGGVQGRILCAFIVDTEGRVSNVEVVDGLHPSLDAEAVRVLSLMPRWISGVNNGEKVNVKCLLPIDFVIDEAPIPPMTKEE